MAQASSQWPAAVAFASRRMDFAAGWCTVVPVQSAPIAAKSDSAEPDTCGATLGRTMRQKRRRPGPVGPLAKSGALRPRLRAHRRDRRYLVAASYISAT